MLSNDGTELIRFADVAVRDPELLQGDNGKTKTESRTRELARRKKKENNESWGIPFSASSPEAVACQKGKQCSMRAHRDTLRDTQPACKQGHVDKYVWALIIYSLNMFVHAFVHVFLLPLFHELFLAQVTKWQCLCVVSEPQSGNNWPKS